MLQKSEFLEKMKNSRNSSTHVLYELVQELEDLFYSESTDAEAIASNYFGGASDESLDTDFESQESESVKEVDHATKFGHAFVFDEDSMLDF